LPDATAEKGKDTSSSSAPRRASLMPA
jgi:hypothetical protein